MDNSRMSTADMLQYCNEALAWDDFGPIDVFFFESVKKILLGQCSAFDGPEEYTDDLMGIERPVSDVELEPEYGNYADIYYGEEGDDDIPDYSRSPEDEAFSAAMFGNGFFADTEQAAPAEPAEEKHEPEKKAASKKSSTKKSAAKKPAAKKPAAKKTASKSKKAAEADKHEETKDGFTVKL